MIDCINSIKTNIDTDSYSIVLVDNPSPKQVAKKLIEYYQTDSTVDILCLENNVGFAKGNNFGIEFARKKYNPKYIVCLNNDTLLEQKNFYSCLESIYNEGNPAVIGPKIILKNNTVQPVISNLMTLAEYISQLNKLENYYGKWQNFIQIVKNQMLKNHLIQFFNKIRHKIIHKPQNMCDPLTIHTDVVLHGCCLIFTPIFFAKLKGFFSGTFLFREEELLFLLIKENNLHNVYNPNLSIRHLEDVSTDSVYKGNSAKQRFMRANQIKSLKILIDVMKQPELLKE